MAPLQATELSSLVYVKDIFESVSHIIGRTGAMHKLQVTHPGANVVLQMITLNYARMLLDKAKQLRKIFVLRAQDASLRAGAKKMIQIAVMQRTSNYVYAVFL